MENQHFFRASVDGCEILHQLKTVVYPIIYRLSTIRLEVQDFATIHSMLIYQRDRKS